MKKLSTRILLIAFLSSIVGYAQADTGAIGTWKTESSDKGYLHVEIAECEDKLCGTIKQQFDLQDQPNAEYEHIGKEMVWNMKSKTDTSWSGGNIWDPSKDKTYKSKMSVKGDTLSVSGCIAFICRSQAWTRVK